MFLLRILFYLFIWLVFLITSMVVGNHKQKFLLGFLLGFFLGPVGLIIILLLPGMHKKNS